MNHPTVNVTDVDPSSDGSDVDHSGPHLTVQVDTS